MRVAADERMIPPVISPKPAIQLASLISHVKMLIIMIPMPLRAKLMMRR